jgi:hypothetical protein
VVWREEQYADAAKLLARLALACVDPDARARPSAAGVASDIAAALDLAAAATATSAPLPADDGWPVNGRECALCLEEYDHLAQQQIPQAQLVPCLHALMCKPCADSLMAREQQPKCPLCRHPIESIREGTYEVTFVGRSARRTANVHARNLVRQHLGV